MQVSIMSIGFSAVFGTDGSQALIPVIYYH